MIDKQTQDQVWECAPKAFRDAVKYEYKHTIYPHVRDILNYFFGHHNLTRLCVGGEVLIVERKRVRELYDYYAKEHRAATPTYKTKISVDRISSGAKIAMLQELFGYKCLPDELEHELEQTSVQVEEKESEPKFKVGDKVRHKGDGKIYTIHMGNGFYLLKDENGTIKDGAVAEQHLEPYTEPNPTNDNMEEKEPRNLSQENANCDKAEDKELNLKEIVDSNFYCGYKECCRNGEGNLPLLKCDKVLCVARVMKPKKWRAEKGGYYYTITAEGTINTLQEQNTSYNNNLYSLGNYFITKELAQQATEAVRKCLEEFHKNHNPHTLIHGDSQSHAERRTV